MALIAVALIAVGAYFYPQASASFGSIDSPTTFGILGTQQLKVGTLCASGFKYASCLGTQVNGINFGQCYIRAYAATIAASSTAVVDCGGGTGFTALNGVTTGDTVQAQFATTTPTADLGLDIIGASASTTPGWLSLVVSNGTGATYTWTAAASTTNYQDFR